MMDAQNRIKLALGSQFIEIETLRDAVAERDVKLGRQAARIVELEAKMKAAQIAAIDEQG